MHCKTGTRLNKCFAIYEIQQNDSIIFSSPVPFIFTGYNLNATLNVFKSKVLYCLKFQTGHIQSDPIQDKKKYSLYLNQEK